MIREGKKTFLLQKRIPWRTLLYCFKQVSGVRKEREATLGVHGPPCSPPAGRCKCGQRVASTGDLAEAVGALLGGGGRRALRPSSCPAPSACSSPSAAGNRTSAVMKKLKMALTKFAGKAVPFGRGVQRFGRRPPRSTVLMTGVMKFFGQGGDDAGERAADENTDGHVPSCCRAGQNALNSSINFFHVFEHSSLTVIIWKLA